MLGSRAWGFFVMPKRLKRIYGRHGSKERAPVTPPPRHGRNSPTLTHGVLGTRDIKNPRPGPPASFHSR